MNQAVQLARLNARVAGLALRGKWLGTAHIAAGYDRVAPTYDQAWHCHLRATTDDLLARLPAGLTGIILDLGCGTGYAARRLAAVNPHATVLAVDISREMLDRAAAGAPANLRCVQGDMLPFLESWAGPEPPRLIVCTWALGYSRPARVLRLAARLLEKGGVLAFVVNYRDTLAPVFRAYQRCMLQFPSQVRLAAWPRFPKDWRGLERALEAAGCSVEWHRDGSQPVEPPPGPLLPWLRQTGILAGFDAMLDLRGPVAAHFEAQLSPALPALPAPLAPLAPAIAHHFGMAIARKRR